MYRVIWALLLSFSCMVASIDLNSASKDQLMSIQGIGAKKAERIIEFREKQAFQSVKDLEKIKGFGAKLIEKIKDKVEVK